MDRPADILPFSARAGCRRARLGRIRDKGICKGLRYKRLRPILCIMKFTSETLSPQSARILPWLVAVAFFMQMLDATILNTALPGMAGDLGVSPLRMQAVVISYMLTTAVFIPASGWLADRFGVKKTFFFAICLFTLGSLFCALASSLELLVVSRVIQGLGGALMVPVGRLAILKGYPRSELMNVLSFVTIPGLVGPLMGPLTGGFLVEYASWHWIFLINLPVGLAGALLTLRYMPELKEERVGGFDAGGFIVFSAALVLITLAMEGFGELRFPKVQSMMLCAGGLLLLALFWLRSARTPSALFSISLFKTRGFTVGILGNLFSRLGSGSMPFLVPLFLQLSLGFSPFKAGLTMIPTALAGILGKQIITPLVKRFGFRAFLTVNTLALGGLIASFSLIRVDTPYVALLLLFGIFGTINSMQFTAMNSVTLIDLHAQNASSGNTLLSVTMQMSASIGVAMAAALLDGFTAAYHLLPSAERLMQVFHSTFLWVGLLSLVTALIFSQAPSRTGERVEESASGESPQAKDPGKECSCEEDSA